MRTANKKHRNIGDIEIVVNEMNNRVIEAWDAKYGKPYLRDELEELNDKLMAYGPVQMVGYVTNAKPEITPDIQNRLNDIKEIHEVEIQILSFRDWFEFWRKRIDKINDIEFTKQWLMAYVESLCQKRRTLAPIDEPSDEWVQDLISNLNQLMQTINTGVRKET
jgi:hypothetical protein